MIKYLATAFLAFTSAQALANTIEVTNSSQQLIKGVLLKSGSGYVSPTIPSVQSSGAFASIEIPTANENDIMNEVVFQYPLPTAQSQDYHQFFCAKVQSDLQFENITTINILPTTRTTPYITISTNDKSEDWACIHD